jgi:hypothetical protein
MTASIYGGRECEVVYTNSTSQSYVTCSVLRDDEAVKEDWFHIISLDFASEVSKYSVLQNFS